MQIISWNVNGIRAVHRKGLFIPLIEEYGPDIVALQETKAEQGQAVIDLPDYKEHWNSSKTRKGYSGTAIFSKNEPISIQIGFPKEIVTKYKLSEDEYGNPNEEGRVITAEYKDFYLVNSYTPNSKPDLTRLKLRHKQWDPAFLEFVLCLEEKKPVIFTGDLNVAHTEDDLAKPRENVGEHGFTAEEREGVDRMIETGYIDAFRMFAEGNGHYTWWHHFNKSRERNVGWRIDYFFVSNKLKDKVQSVNILSHIMGSDHCPIQITLKDIK